MTAPGAGTPAATAPGRAAAFGQVALEAFTAARDADTGEGYNPADWDKLHDGWWEAAAQAAITAARVPSVVVHFDGKVTEERAAEIRETIAAAMAEPPLAVAAKIRDLERERDGLTGRVAELAASLEASAKLTAPSKKTEIETALAEQLRGLLAGGTA